jgi:hypothetical protein
MGSLKIKKIDPDCSEIGTGFRGFEVYEVFSLVQGDNQ